MFFDENIEGKYDNEIRGILVLVGTVITLIGSFSETGGILMLMIYILASIAFSIGASIRFIYGKNPFHCMECLSCVMPCILCIVKTQLISSPDSNAFTNTYYVVFWLSIIILAFTICLRIHHLFQQTENAIIFYLIISFEIVMALIEIQIGRGSSQQNIQNTSISIQNLYLSSGSLTLMFLSILWIYFELQVFYNQPFNFLNGCFALAALFILDQIVYLILFSQIPSITFFCGLKIASNSFKILVFLVVAMSPSINKDKLKYYEKSINLILICLEIWFLVDLAIFQLMRNQLQDYIQNYTLSWKNCLYFNVIFGLALSLFLLFEVLALNFFTNQLICMVSKITAFFLIAMPFKACIENIIIHLIYPFMNEYYSATSINYVNWFLAYNYLMVLGMIVWLPLVFLAKKH